MYNAEYYISKYFAEKQIRFLQIAQIFVAYALLDKLKDSHKRMKLIRAIDKFHEGLCST